MGQDGNLVRIASGISLNEALIDGQSATKSPRVYGFKEGPYDFQLIDTPGVGDSQGIEKDKENFANIIECTRQFKQIHAILILLKPNDANLTLMFRFCVTELLSHLHVSALNNVMFVFTHTRTTSFRPGETLPILRELLKSSSQHVIPITTSNVFCFDSESYRFLAAVKQGVTFSKSIREDNIDSWQHSSVEAIRLLDQIRGLEPHRMEDSYLLHKICELIQNLIQPITEITKTISMNMMMLEAEEDAVKAGSRKQKKGHAEHFPRSNAKLVTKMLKQGNVVCTHPDCITLEDYLQHKIVIYSKKCHRECKEFKLKDKLGTQDLSRCWMMSANSGLCWGCNHPHTDHVYMMTETTVVHEGAQTMDASTMTDESIPENRKHELIREKIVSLEQEKKEIEEIACKLGLFLRRNAIVATTDYWLEYLDILCKQEEKMAHVTKDNSILNQLYVKKNFYLNFMKTSDEMYKNSGQTVTQSDVRDMIERLCTFESTSDIMEALFEDDPGFLMNPKD
jgi:hypothetical protein